MKLRLVAILLPAVLVAACTSSGKPAGHGSASSTPTTAAGLGRMMESAIAKVSSARFTLDVSIAGQSLTGSGSEKLEHGRLVSVEVTEHLPQGTVQVIVVDGKTYAKLPKALNPSGKPYLRVSPSSSNPVIKTLAGSLNSALASASLGDVSTFTRAAQSVKAVGTATVAGARTTHYTVVVDLAKLPASYSAKQALQAGGVRTLPLELYVDQQGRPARLTENFRTQGTQVKTDLTITGYNVPVTITAPPADQVGG
jgi:hypothetical protein